MAMFEDEFRKHKVVRMAFALHVVHDEQFVPSPQNPTSHTHVLAPGSDTALSAHGKLSPSMQKELLGHSVQLGP